MSIAPKHKPSLTFEHVWASAVQAMLVDRGIGNLPLLIGRSRMFVVAVRGYGDKNRIGKYDDAIVLLDLDAMAIVGQWFGNVDPGKYGPNPTAGKDYASLVSGRVFPMMTTDCPF